MNSQLQKFARKTLKEGLAQCTPAQQDLFKRMYVYRSSRGGAVEEIANAKNTSVNEVVDKMPEGKLDWAMQQVESTLHKNKRSAKESFQTP
jgi:hypothetical protein